MDFTVELWFKPKSKVIQNTSCPYLTFLETTYCCLVKQVLINYLAVDQAGTCQRRWRDGENLTFLNTWTHLAIVQKIKLLNFSLTVLKYTSINVPLQHCNFILDC